MRFAKYKLLGGAGLNVTTYKSHVAALAADPSLCGSNRGNIIGWLHFACFPALLLHTRYLKLLLCLEHQYWSLKKVVIKHSLGEVFMRAL